MASDLLAFAPGAAKTMRVATSIFVPSGFTRPRCRPPKTVLVGLGRGLIPAMQHQPPPKPRCFAAAGVRGAEEAVRQPRPAPRPCCARAHPQPCAAMLSRPSRLRRDGLRVLHHHELHLLRLRRTERRVHSGTEPRDYSGSISRSISSRYYYIYNDLSPCCLHSCCCCAQSCFLDLAA